MNSGIKRMEKINIAPRRINLLLLLVLRVDLKISLVPQLPFGQEKYKYNVSIWGYPQSIIAFDAILP